MLFARFEFSSLYFNRRVCLFFEFAETAAALAHSSAVGGALSEKSAALDSLQLESAQTASRLAAAGAQMRRGDEQREVCVCVMGVWVMCVWM